jgi:hypothetical protein
MRRNYPLFISNTTVATGGEGTALSSEITRGVLVVEVKLPTL